MEVKLTANFPGGTSWTTEFWMPMVIQLSGDLVSLGKQDSTDSSISNYFVMEFVCRRY